MTLKEEVLDKKNELVKHTGAIHIVADLNITARKISNTLLKNAYNNLLKKEKHAMRISDLMNEIGYNSNNVQFLNVTLSSLMTTTIEWNSLGKDNKNGNGWTKSVLLASYSMKNGIIEYSYSPHLKVLLANPNIYARLNLMIQRSIKSIYALILWEFFVEALCSSLKNEIQTEWFSLSAYKKLLCVKENEHQQFKMLNNRLIKEPLKEINTLTDILVEAHYKKEGRKVVAVSFIVKRKYNYQLSLDLSAQNYIESDITDINISKKGRNESIYLLDVLRKEFLISAKKGKQLIASYTNEEIENAIGYVRKAIKSKKKINDIAGFTVTAIEEGWEGAKTSQEFAIDDIEKTITEYENSITHLGWKKACVLLKDVLFILKYQLNL
jgi:plasmid replication initiation protein